MSRLVAARTASLALRPTSCLSLGSRATATASRPTLFFQPATLVQPRCSLTTKATLKRPHAEPHSASSTLPPLPSATSQATALPLSLRTHNALHQAARLFPSADTWAQRCRATASELSQRTTARVAFVGVDAAAGRNVLTALLDDPLAASARMRKATSSEEELQREVRAVRERQEKGVRITHGQEATFEKGSLTLPLPWLKDTEIIEAIDLEAAEEMLYSADTLILVISSRTLARLVQPGHLQPDDKHLLSTLRRHLAWPTTQFVIDTSSSSEASSPPSREAIEQALHPARAALFLNAQQAERANDALRKALAPSAGNDVAQHWQVFQSNYAASNMALLHDLIVEPPLLAPSTSTNADLGSEASTRVQKLALQTAARLLSDALQEAESRVWNVEADVKAAEGLASVLEFDAERTVVELRERVLATPSARQGVANSTTSTASTRVHERAGDRSSAAIGALTDSGAQLEQALARMLPWWKLGWKVDDVGAEVESAVLRSFAKDLEEQLIFEAGRLLSEAELQSRRTQEALSTLSDRAPTFASSLLLNTVSQHTLSAARSALHPRSLSSPISARRAQLLSTGGPLDALVARAQTLVVSTYLSLATLGATCSLLALARHPKLATIPYLGESLAAALEPLSLNSSTAGGVAALGAVVLAWRAQGKWGKSKRAFWRDWERLARGLDADLEETVTRLLREHIVAQPLTASAALRAMVLRRTSELEEKRALLEHVQRQVAELAEEPVNEAEKR